MAKKEEQTFKISDLHPIENLDEKDLFLVSDYEGGKCYTRKITYGMLTDYLGKNPLLILKILDDQELSVLILQKVDSAVSTAIDITTIIGGNASE